LFQRNVLTQLQKLSKGLMAPTAVLPAAALLKRLGAPDVFNLHWMYAAGDTVFNNLSLLFAIGIAVGIAEENNGIAGLAALVGHLVLTGVAATFDPTINVGILSGLIVGVLAGFFYNKYHSIKLPTYLGFFGGKRFVPILTSLCSVLLGILTGWLWPPFQQIVNSVGNSIAGSGYIGGFFFGFCNRLLIPFGLHHVLNTVVWFQFGQYKTGDSKFVHGDLTRFFAGDPSAGTFMTGFFPIMLFALPAACIAMIVAARKKHRKSITGMLLSVAFTSFLTGITEPIEFLFMFLSPLLYLIHALLTGVSLAVVSMLGIRSGFGFSAGMIDFLLNFGIASKPLLLLLFGLGYGVLYYFVFLFAIKKWNIPTPGRLDEEESSGLLGLNSEELKERCAAILKAMGGYKNIEAIDACVTRIRLAAKDGQRINEKRLIELGAANILKMSGKNYQIVVGTMADPIVSHIKALMKKGVSAEKTD
jgi:Phosphotransferase system IIC components, glucose/maltose/N-acetylglucosamine-specific